MITAAVPTYNNSKIIWIQLTALCNQIDAPEWELIVCEEPSENMLGIDGLKEWTERLQKANCKRIIYLALDKWVALGQKWIIIRDNMHHESVGMMLCASDNYSPNDRIRKSYESMVNGHDWFQTQSGYFYNIVAHKAGKFKALENHPALFMCASKRSLNRVNESNYPTKGVDTWLLRETRPESKQLDEWTDGVHTDGYNTISLNRRFLYSDNSGGLFENADESIVWGMFPSEVQDNLTKLMNP
jgi:hypothetical protein